jgi:hypothetical protein
VHSLPHNDVSGPGQGVEFVTVSSTELWNDCSSDCHIIISWRINLYNADEFAHLNEWTRSINGPNLVNCPSISMDR